MQGISCYVNFKENLNKNIPYYSLLMHQLNGIENDIPPSNQWIGENAVLCASFSTNIISRICEGYQFTIAFQGELDSKNELKNKLANFGYTFCSENSAELALFSYIHFGEKCSEFLAGNFSFIIYDSMRCKIFALCDPSGSMPLFYAKTGNGIIISSSLKGILTHPDTPKKLSSHNLFELLSIQNRISTNILDDIHILPPREFLKLSRNEIKTIKYTDSRSQPESTVPETDTQATGIILSGTSIDHVIFKSLIKSQKKEHKIIDVYTYKCPDSYKQFPLRIHSLSIDDGTVLNSLETCVSACGFPLASIFDFILTIALRKTKHADEVLLFAHPDSIYPKKDYIYTLIKNNAFYPSLENNIKDYTPDSSVFPPYTQLISSTYDTTVIPAHLNISHPDKEDLLNAQILPTAIKTALRHILLDIISQEHSPIIAFFKRSSLLRLCEGGFTFLPGESEYELISYLIKLNIWFEMYHPRII